MQLKHFELHIYALYGLWGHTRASQAQAKGVVYPDEMLEAYCWFELTTVSACLSNHSLWLFFSFTIPPCNIQKWSAGQNFAKYVQFLLCGPIFMKK